MSSNKPLKIPFSYFGGKSRVANTVWSGLGEVSNYVEPFAGSLAVLLGAPKIPKIETVNDCNCHICNFWRAVSFDPEGVIKFADYPVNEADLHARHKWLVSATDNEFISKMHSDPDYYDVKMAGYWVWGVGASVGNNWLQTKGLSALPLLSSAGGGIHGLTYNLQEDFVKLQSRLRRVRVACGDWKRVITPSITFKNKGLSPKDITGVFLDPPYAQDKRDAVYAHDNNIYQEVCQWAVENGDNTRLRIVICGYNEDFNFPNSWKEYHWSANGGMGNLGNGQGKQNAKREVIYFSPHCLPIIG